MISNSCFVCRNMLYQSGFSRESEPSRYMKCRKYPRIILDPITHRLYYMELTHVIMETEKSEDMQSSPKICGGPREATVQSNSKSRVGEVQGSSQKKGREPVLLQPALCTVQAFGKLDGAHTHMGDGDLLTQSIYSRSSHAEPASQTYPE